MPSPVGDLFKDLLNRLAKEHYRQIGGCQHELQRAKDCLRQAGIPQEDWSLKQLVDIPHASIATEGDRKKAVMIKDTDDEAAIQGCSPSHSCCQNDPPENDDFWQDAAKAAQLSAIFNEHHVEHRFGFQDAFARGHPSSEESKVDEDALDKVIEVVDIKMSREATQETTASIQTSSRVSISDSIRGNNEASSEAFEMGEASFEQHDSGLRFAAPQPSWTSQTRSNSREQANRSKKKHMTTSKLRQTSIASSKHGSSSEFGLGNEFLHGTTEELDTDLEHEPRLPGHLTVSPAWASLAELAYSGEETSRNSSNIDGSRTTDHSARKSAEQKRMGFRERGRQGNNPSLSTTSHRGNTHEKLCSLKRLIAQPSSRGRLCWDVTGMVLLGFDIVMVPIQVFEPEEHLLLTAANYITGGFWTMDLLACFFVGYHTQGTVEMDPFKIAVHYIKSWFFLDLLLVFLDWIFLLIGTENKGSSRVIRMGKLSRGMRVIRLLRVMKFRVVFSDIMESIHSEYKRTLIGVAKWVVFIITINHYIACGFYGLHHVGNLLDEENTWVKTNLPLAEHTTFLYRYGTSLHWSLTQFTPASMEVVPENGIERLYNICVLLFALVTFSTFVSSITNAMTHLRNIDAKKMEEDAALRRYLGEHAITHALVNRVLHFLQERQVQKGRLVRTKEVDVELFKTLPDSLKNELRVETFQPSIKIHPFFHNYGVLEPQALRQICRTAMAEVSLTIREELFGDGGKVPAMLFLNEGRLRYQFHGDEENVSVIVNKGQWACEAALWAASAELHSPLVAECTCELALFTSADFIVCAKRFPQTLSVVVRYAELFMEEVQKEAAKHRWLSMLCNDFDQIQDIVYHAFSEYSRLRADADEDPEGLDFDNNAVVRSSASREDWSAKSTWNEGWIGRVISMVPRRSMTVPRDSAAAQRQSRA